VIKVTINIVTEKTAENTHCTPTRTPQRGHSTFEMKSSDIEMELLEQAGQFLRIYSPPYECSLSISIWRVNPECKNYGGSQSAFHGRAR
jgi:hypothetical protein